MAARLTFAGVPELKAALRTLPAALVAEGAEEIAAASSDAADAVRAAYGRHRVTGNLANHVVVRKKVSGGPFAVKYEVKSTAPHATIFERGTEARHYITVHGKTKSVGRMPPFNIFGPILARYRRFMWDGIYSVLRKHGFIVSGTP